MHYVGIDVSKRSARIVRSDQSPNPNKSLTGLSGADHSTNSPWRTTPDAESHL